MTKKFVIIMLLFMIILIPETGFTSSVQNPGYEEGFNVGNNDKKALIEKRSDAAIDLYIESNYPLYKSDEEWKTNFKTGYTAGYGESLSDPTKVWESSGKKLGDSLGQMKATEDYYSRKPSDWKLAMPSEYALIQEYQLLRLGTEERQAFISSYISAFEASYNKTYASLIDNETQGLSVWNESADKLGKSNGKRTALEDLQNNKPMNWSAKIPNDSEILNKYSLQQLSPTQRSAFLNTYKNAYKKEYEKIYSDSLTDFADLPSSNGSKDGESAGKALGEMNGRNDYYSGKEMNASFSMPSDERIIIQYSLNKTDDNYKSAFIISFKNIFISSYLEGYRAAMTSEVETSMSSGFENGSSVGEKIGMKNATADKMRNLSYDPIRNRMDSSKIFSEYNLFLHNETYAEDFVSGFIQAYNQAYDTTYKTLTTEDALNKTTVETLELAGGEILSSDNRFAVNVPGGIYFDTVMVTIDQLNSKFITNFGFNEASKPYRIGILSPNSGIDISRKISLAFEYYGKPKVAIGDTEDGLPGNAFNAGIYMLEGNVWKYIDSKIVENSVIAEVSPDRISEDGSIFALIIDTSYNYLYDIRGHWAKDEINAMIRRGVISGYPDKTFRADKPISRAEFLVLLSKHYNWKLGDYAGYANYFTDSSIFEFYSPYIDYGVANKYIIGYPDGEYKPNRFISYREINWIMQRITKNPTFDWRDYSKLMMNNESIRSKSYDSMDNKITRAEFAYMVYMMDKWKY